MFRTFARAGLVLVSVLSAAPLAIAGGDDVEPGSAIRPTARPSSATRSTSASARRSWTRWCAAGIGKGQVILTRTDPEGKFRFGAFGRRSLP